MSLEPSVVKAENSIEVLKKLENTFKYIMTWQDDLIDNRKYIKINYPQNFGEDTIQKVDFKSEKLLINISGYKFSAHPDELYSKRLEVITLLKGNFRKVIDLIIYVIRNPLWVILILLSRKASLFIMQYILIYLYNIK